MKTKGLFFAGAVLAAVSLGISIFLLVYLFAPPPGPAAGGILNFEYAEDSQYILYIGLNDRDTYAQIIPTAEAREIVDRICAAHVDGYTVSEAEGGWVDEKGVLTQERTLVYAISFADEADIVALMDEVLIALNQNSILVEKRGVSSAFYSGGE